MQPSHRQHPGVPPQPIDSVVSPILRFLHIEAASGIVLLAATVAALGLANSSLAGPFLDFWKTQAGFQFGDFIFRHSLKHLINDGLMAIFFFVIGLEVKREIVRGELRDLRSAALPIAAALGGMLVPAAIYLSLQAGQPGARGWGIPMATDIAFVVGCMAVLGRRVPQGLRVMLLALAIADDIGAILVIAIGYTSHLNLTWLLIALAGFAVVFACARLGVRSLLVYTFLGVVIWFAFHESGVHATLAGVVLGLMTPARSLLLKPAAAGVLDHARRVVEEHDWNDEAGRVKDVRRHRNAAMEMVSPVEFLIDALHPWVSFVIMPIFALANAGVPIHLSALGAPIAIAVALGLFLGKPIGIALASYLAVRSGIGRLPESVTWPQIIGGGLLSGIGFTMALFIAGLALDDSMLDTAKVGVLAGSLASGVAGMIVLWLVYKPAQVPPEVSPKY